METKNLLVGVAPQLAPIEAKHQVGWKL